MMRWGVFGDRAGSTECAAPAFSRSATDSPTPSRNGEDHALADISPAVRRRRRLNRCEHLHAEWVPRCPRRTARCALREAVERVARDSSLFDHDESPG